jgi:hypothetical protein
MSELAYVCRPNMFSDERTYTLASDGIAMSGKDGARSRIALRNVTRVVVYFIGLGEGRSYCRVDSNKNESLVFGSHHFAGMSSFENKRHDFDPFVRALCARVAEQSPKAQFFRGRWLYVGLWSVGFLVMAGLAIGLGLAFFFELAQYDALNTELGAGAVVGGILAYKAVRAAAVNWVKSFPANTPPFDA